MCFKFANLASCFAELLHKYNACFGQELSMDFYIYIYICFKQQTHRSTQAENGPRNQNESQCDVHNDSVTQDILTDSSRLQRCVSDIMALCRRAVLNPETMDDSFSNKIHRSIQQHILVPQNVSYKRRNNLNSMNAISSNFLFNLSPFSKYTCIYLRNDYFS